MLDIKKIRNNSDKILQSLAKKDKNISLDNILRLDDSLKTLTTKLNELQADQNSKSKEVGILKSKGESAEDIFADLKILSDKIKELEKEQRELSLSNDNKGVFSDMEPTVHKNQDLDIPTYRRKNIKYEYL